jgi:hypothetical protein
MHAKTEHPAHADIPTRFRDTSCSDNSETGGCVVPPCPSDQRDVRLFLVIAMDPEEPEAVTDAIAGKRGLHGHHVPIVICPTCDEDALKPPFQRQPEFFPAVDLLVDDGHRRSVPGRVKARSQLPEWPIGPSLLNTGWCREKGNAAPVVYRVIVWSELSEMVGGP